MASELPGARYLHGRETAFVWNNIRLLRSRPPALAGGQSDGLKDGDLDGRRDLFTASLEQFEQLVRAAATAGPATRPIALFYALDDVPVDVPNG